jgi:hypothetical protein
MQVSYKEVGEFGGLIHEDCVFASTEVVGSFRMSK